LTTIFDNLQRPELDFNLCLKTGDMIGKDKNGKEVKVKLFEAKGQPVDSWKKIYHTILKKPENKDKIIEMIYNYLLEEEKKDNRLVDNYFASLEQKYNTLILPDTYENLAANFENLLKVLEVQLKSAEDKKELCNDKTIPERTLNTEKGAFNQAKSSIFLQQVWWGEFGKTKRAQAICVSKNKIKFVYQNGIRRDGVWLKEWFIIG